MKQETRGRKPLKNKPHRCFVSVPYDVNELLMNYVKRHNMSISCVLLQALKRFLNLE